MIGLTQREYDSKERKRSKGEKIILMTSMRDLMTPKRSSSSVREAERRSLFLSIHAGTNVSAGVEHLSQNAKGRR